MNSIIVRAKNISKQMEVSFWKLGGLLYRIRDGEIYREIGYSCFKDFCEKELYCTLRTAQVSIQLNIWKKTLGSREAEKWIESIPWSYTKVCYKLINSDNWKDWKKEYNGLKNGRKFYDLMVEYKQKQKKVNGARKNGVDLRSLNKLMDDINFVDDPILYLKNSRLNDRVISDMLGISVAKIRNSTKYVRCILPIDVYLKALNMANESNTTVEQEISEALIVLYRGEEDGNLSKVS